GAARDQRERRAAPAVEPAADIDVERGVEARIADQAHEEAVADPQRQAGAEGRDAEADADHDGAGDHGPAEALARRDRPPRAAAKPGAEPGERGGERRNRARVAGVGRDRLEADRDDPQAAEREGEAGERYRGDNPRLARLYGWLIRAYGGRIHALLGV